ncbi:hypothetical protein SK128_026511 [Halocaridina rubra]|uniref:Uncharacterized protein n=1 Tax=Halocaridina rubra TaxID=373956 RepID=A0AAN8XIT4_HALRR
MYRTRSLVRSEVTSKFFIGKVATFPPSLGHPRGRRARYSITRLDSRSWFILIASSHDNSPHTRPSQFTESCRHSSLLH